MIMKKNKQRVSAADMLTALNLISGETEDQRILALKEMLEKKAKEENALEHSKEFHQVYQEFLINLTGLPPKRSAADNKAMQQIIKYLIQCSRDGSKESALLGWQHILQKWDNIGDFLKQTN